MSSSISIKAPCTLAELSAAQCASFRVTSYTVSTPRLLRLQAGVRNSDLIQLLRAHNALTAAVVTAYNPFGRKVAITQNKTRHAKLAATIKKLKLACLPAERKPQDNGTDAEAGYLIFNITGAQAEALLIEFDQQALLWCNQSGAPELMLHPLVRRRGI
jgi:hypothetical protein